MTRAVSILLLSSLTLTVQGQAPTDIFEKAPPGVEEALRARVNQFYGFWVEGKFRAAEKLVAESSQEIYYSMQKQKFAACEIIRLKFERDFTDAIVTVSCKGKWIISGVEMDSTMAHTDVWSFEKDLWMWTVKPVQNMETPFGPSHFGNIEGAKDLFNGESGLPKDFDKLGRAILKQVSVDKQQVELSSFEKSSAVVTIKNGINGIVDVEAIANVVMPGLSWKFDKTKIPGQSEAKLTISYVPKDKTPKPATEIRVTVDQTRSVFPITITFAIPDDLKKMIEKSKTGKQ